MNGGGDKTKLLYENLQGRELYTKSYEEFVQDYSTPKSKEFLYSSLKDMGLVDVPATQWVSDWFDDAPATPGATPGRQSPDVPKAVTAPWEKPKSADIWSLPAREQAQAIGEQNAYEALMKRRGEDLVTPAHLLAQSGLSQFRKDELEQSRTPLEAGLKKEQDRIYQINQEYNKLVADAEEKWKDRTSGSAYVEVFEAADKKVKDFYKLHERVLINNAAPQATLARYNFEVGALSEDMQQIEGAVGYIDRQLAAQLGSTYMEDHKARIKEAEGLMSQLKTAQTTPGSLGRYNEIISALNKRQSDPEYQAKVAESKKILAQLERGQTPELVKKYNDLVGEINAFQNDPEYQAQVKEAEALRGQINTKQIPAMAKRQEELVKRYNEVVAKIQEVENHPLVAQRNKLADLYQNQFESAKSMLKEERFQTVADYLDIKESAQDYTDEKSREGLPGFDEVSIASGLWARAKRYGPDIAKRAAGKMLASIGAIDEVIENRLFGDAKYNWIDAWQDYMRGFEKDAQVIAPTPSNFSRPLITNTAKWKPDDRTFDVDFDKAGNIQSIRDEAGYVMKSILSEEQKAEISALPREKQSNWATLPYKTAEIMADLGTLMLTTKGVGGGLKSIGMGAKAAGYVATPMAVAGQMMNPLYEQGLEMFDGDKDKASQFAAIAAPGIGMISSLIGSEAIIAGGGKSLLGRVMGMKGTLRNAYTGLTPGQAATRYIGGVLREGASEAFEETILEELVTSGTAAFLGKEFEMPDMDEMKETAILSAITGSAFASVTELGNKDMKYASLLTGMDMGDKFISHLEKAVESGLIPVEEGQESKFVANERARLTELKSELDAVAPFASREQRVQVLELLDARREERNRLSKLKAAGTPASQLLSEQRIAAINNKIDSMLNLSQTIQQQPAVVGEQAQPVVAEQTVVGEQQPTVATEQAVVDQQQQTVVGEQAQNTLQTTPQTTQTAPETAPTTGVSQRLTTGTVVGDNLAASETETQQPVVRKQKEQLNPNTTLQQAVGKRAIRYNKAGTVVEEDGTYYIQTPKGEMYEIGKEGTLYDNDVTAYEDRQMSYVSDNEIYLGESTGGPHEYAGVTRDGEGGIQSVNLVRPDGQTITVRDKRIAQEIYDQHTKERDVMGVDEEIEAEVDALIDEDITPEELAGADALFESMPDAAERFIQNPDDTFTPQELEDIRDWADGNEETKFISDEVKQKQDAMQAPQDTEGAPGPVDGENQSIAAEGQVIESEQATRRFAVRLAAAFNRFFGATVKVVTDKRAVQARLSQPDAIASKRLMFVGPIGVSESSQIEMLSTLEMAREMESSMPEEIILGDDSGADVSGEYQTVKREDFIFHTTGWFKFPDGKWRRSLPPGWVQFTGAKVTGEPMLLEEVISGEIFNMYPQLRGFQVKFTGALGARGQIEYSTNVGMQSVALPEGEVQAPDVRLEGARTITINSKVALDSEQMRETMLHEIQHAIQAIEGFGRGASPHVSLRVHDPAWRQKNEEYQNKKKLAIAKEADVRNKFMSLPGDVIAVLHEALSRMVSWEVNPKATGVYNTLWEHLAGKDGNGNMLMGGLSILSEMLPKTPAGKQAEAIANAIWFAELDLHGAKRAEPKTTQRELLDMYMRTHGEVEARLASAYPGIANPLRAFEQESNGEAIVIDVVKGDYDKPLPRYLKTPNGDIYGMYDPETNTIFVDPEKIGPETALHEMAEAWLAMIENRYPEMFDRGIELIRGSVYEEYVRESYPHLKDDRDILREALAQAIGDEGALLLKKQNDGLVAWLKDMWNAITKWAGVFKSPDSIANMTVDEFIKLGAGSIVFADQLSGIVEDAFVDDFLQKESDYVSAQQIRDTLDPVGKRGFDTAVESYNSWSRMPISKLPANVATVIRNAAASGLHPSDFKQPAAPMAPAANTDTELTVRRIDAKLAQRGLSAEGATVGLLGRYNLVKNFIARMTDPGALDQFLPFLRDLDVQIGSLKKNIKIGKSNVKAAVGALLKKEVGELRLLVRNGATNAQITEALATEYGKGFTRLDVQGGIALQGGVDSEGPFLEVVDIDKGKKMRIDGSDLVALAREQLGIKTPSQAAAPTVQELAEALIPETLEDHIALFFAAGKRISDQSFFQWSDRNYVKDNNALYYHYLRKPEKGGVPIDSMLDGLDQSFENNRDANSRPEQAVVDFILTQNLKKYLEHRVRQQDGARLSDAFYQATDVGIVEEFRRTATPEENAEADMFSVFPTWPEVFDFIERIGAIEKGVLSPYIFEILNEVSRTGISPQEFSGKSMTSEEIEAYTTAAIEFVYGDDTAPMNQAAQAQPEVQAEPPMDLSGLSDEDVNMLLEIINNNTKDGVIDWGGVEGEANFYALTGPFSQNITDAIARQQGKTGASADPVRAVEAEATVDEPRLPDRPGSGPGRTTGSDIRDGGPATPVENDVIGTYQGRDITRADVAAIDDGDLTLPKLQRGLKLGFNAATSIFQEYNKQIGTPATPTAPESTPVVAPAAPDAEARMRPVKINGIEAIDENGDVSKEFTDRIETLKKNNDRDGLNEVYTSVRIVLNGVAQGAGEKTVKAFEEIKADLEQFAKKGNKTDRPGLVTASEDLIPEPTEYVAEGQYQIGPEQRFAVNAILSRFLGKKGKGFLLADGTGVGKTRQILATADAFRKATGKKVLIISQNKQILDNNFANDAKAMGIKMSDFETGTYDGLRTGQAGKGEYGLVIYDEAHNLKDATRGKSIAAAGLKTDHTLYTTATPMDSAHGSAYFIAALTNKPIDEVFNMLGFSVKRFTDEKTGETKVTLTIQKGTDPRQIKQNIIALRDEIIAEGAMLRREYPMYGTVTEARVPMSSKQEAQEQQIHEYWDEEEAMAENENGVVPPLKLMGLRGERSRETGALNESAKVEYIFNQAKKDMAAGKKVVIIAEFVKASNLKGLGAAVPGFIETIVSMFEKEGIKVAKIYGKHDKAQANRDFQEGDAMVVVGTAASASTGIDLDDQVGNAPRKLYMVTPNYSGNVFQQILGRVSRRNTKSPAEIELVYSNSGSDTRRREIVQNKLGTLRAIQEGRIEDEIDFEGIQMAPEPMDPTGDYQFEAISDKAFVVKGDTRPIKDKLKELGGKWHRGHSAWMFPKSREEEIRAALTPQEAVQEAEAINTPEDSDVPLGEVSLEDLQAESEMFNQKIKDEKDRLNEIDPGRQIIGSWGMSYLSEADAIRMSEVNDEIERRTRVSPEEAAQRRDEARKKRLDSAAQAAPAQDMREFIPTKSPKQIELEARIDKAETELAQAQAALKEKRRELDKTLMADQEDLFGERKSQEPGMLFDERADTDARSAALAPYERRVKSAQDEVKRLRNLLPDMGGPEPTIFDSIPPPTEFGIFGKGFFGVQLSKVTNEKILRWINSVWKHTFTPQGFLNRTTWARNLKRMGWISGEMRKAELLSNRLKSTIKEVYYIPKTIAGRVVSRSKPTNMDAILKNLDEVLRDPLMHDSDPAIRQAFYRYKNLDPRIGEILYQMRKHVDAMSAELVALGVVDGDLAISILGNMETYLTRSYQVHDDPDWITKIKDGPAWNKARAWLKGTYADRIAVNRDLRQEYLDFYDKAATLYLRSSGPATQAKAMKAMQHWRAKITQADTEYTRLEDRFQNKKGALDAELETMLLEQQESLSVSGVGAKGSLGSKDLGILKQRKDIPPALLELYGEHLRPDVNYMRSIFKQIHLLENAKFLRDVETTGVAEGWLTIDPEGPHVEKIAAESSSVMAPLNGYHTTRELAQAFKEYNEASNRVWGTGMTFWIGMMSASKYSKTILSWTTQLVNFFSNTAFMWMNGHYVNPVVDIPLALAGRANKNFQEAWDLAWTEIGVLGKDGRNDEAIKELYEEGVLGESVTWGEINELLTELRASSGRTFDNEGWDNVMTKIESFLGGAQKLYQFGDNFWKILMYSLERQRVAKLRFGGKYDTLRSEDQQAVNEIAADRTRNLLPTYSLIPKNIRALRLFPGVGTFVSFPYEATRTFFNAWKYGIQDAMTKTTYKENGLDYAKMVALRKVMGMSLMTAGMYGLAAVARNYWDIDDEEAMADSLPPWAKNSIIVPLFRDGAEYVYVDVGRNIPHGYILKAINPIIYDRPDKAKTIIGEILDPFLGVDMTFGAMLEAALNQKNLGEQRKISAPDEPSQIFWENRGGIPTMVTTGAYKRLQHAMAPFVPGTATSLNRLQKSIFDPELNYSGKLDPWVEGLSLTTGLRVSPADAESATIFIARDLGERKFGANQILSSEAKKQKYETMPEEEKEKMLKRYRENSKIAYDIVMSEAIKKYSNAIKMQADEAEVEANFERSGFNATEIQAIKEGVIPEQKHGFEKVEKKSTKKRAPSKKK